MKKYRYYWLLAILLANSLSAFSQMNGNRLSLGVGALYERGLDATLSWEHETRYHNAWEYFANAYIKWDKDQDAGHVTKHSFWHNYFAWAVGVAYKPCVVRGRNHYGSLRLGASAGSDTDIFVGALHVGYEHNYALKHGWQLFWQFKSDVVALHGEDLFRTGFVLGVKFPLGRR